MKCSGGRSNRIADGLNLESEGKKITSRFGPWTARWMVVMSTEIAKTRGTGLGKTEFPFGVLRLRSLSQSTEMSSSQLGTQLLSSK